MRRGLRATGVELFLVFEKKTFRKPLPILKRQYGSSRIPEKYILHLDHFMGKKELITVLLQSVKNLSVENFRKFIKMIIIIN